MPSLGLGLPERPHPWLPPRMLAGLASALALASGDCWAVGKDGRLCKVKKWFLHRPDSVLASPGPHGQCHRQGCSSRLGPSGEGGTGTVSLPRLLPTMASSGIRVQECSQHSVSSSLQCLVLSRHSVMSDAQIRGPYRIWHLACSPRPSLGR